jgi:hypothetical protein
MSFNDANVTGNYAVLHAKLSKPFRDQFTPDGNPSSSDRTSPSRYRACGAGEPHAAAPYRASGLVL